jgi:hypothetical protein
MVVALEQAWEVLGVLEQEQVLGQLVKVKILKDKLESLQMKWKPF